MSTNPLAVTVLWDYENAWIRDGYNLADLKTKILQALHQHNAQMTIPGKIIACGPVSWRYPILQQHGTTIEHMSLEDVKMMCDGCNARMVAGPSGSTKQKDMRKIDRADIYLHKNMFMDTIDGGKRFLIITGDRDFLDSIPSLKEEGNFIMAATNDTSDADFSCAQAVWIWKSEKPENRNYQIIDRCGPKWLYGKRRR